MTVVSEAVGALLAPYFPPAKWCGAAPRVIGLPLTTTIFERIADATPRLYIGWSGMKAAGATTHSFAGPMTYSVVVVIKNTSSENAHLGDKHGPGLYPSLIGVAAALHGRKVADIGSITVTELGQQPAERWSSFGAAAGYVTFTIHTDLGDFLGESAAAEDFLRLVSDFETGRVEEGAEPPVATSITINLPGASS